MKTHLILMLMLVCVNLVHSQNISNGIVTEHPDYKFIYDNEPDIAINPNDVNNLIVTTNNRKYSMDFEYLAGRIGIYRSTDLGNQWTTNLIENSNYNKLVDPSVGFDLNNNCYVGYLATSTANPANSSIIVSRSSNRGESWLKNTIIEEADYETDLVEFDKPYLNIDTHSGSPYQNRAYISYVEINLTEGSLGYEKHINTIKASYSNDGINFSNPIAINDLSTTSYAMNPIPITDKQGNVYVTFYKEDDNQQSSSIKILKSTNGGIEFDAFSTGSKTVADINKVNNDEFGFRNNSFQDVAIDLSNGNFANDIYIVWTDYVNTNENDKTDIMLSKSTDGGVSWQNIGKINPEISGDQFFPSISVNENGRISVVYYHMDDRTTEDISTHYIRNLCKTPNKNLKKSKIINKLG